MTDSRHCVFCNFYYFCPKKKKKAHECVEFAKKTVNLHRCSSE